MRPNKIVLIFAQAFDTGLMLGIFVFCSLLLTTLLACLSHTNHSCEWWMVLLIIIIIMIILKRSLLPWMKLSKAVFFCFITLSRAVLAYSYLVYLALCSIHVPTLKNNLQCRILRIAKCSEHSLVTGIL